MTMFESSDFSLPLEQELRMRVISDEINECKNVEILQTNLKQTTRLTMLYQHMLNEIVKRQLTGEVERFEKEMLGLLSTDKS